MKTRNSQRKIVSIHRRLFILIIFFIALPVLIMGWLWYESSTRTIEQSAIETNRRFIEQTGKNLDLYITNLENSTYPIVTSALTQQFLAPGLPSAYPYYQLTEKVENDLFAQMIYGRSDIVGISLVGKNSLQINDFSEAKEILDMNTIRSRNADLLKRLDTLGNFEVLGLNRIGSSPVLTVARKLHSSSTYLYEGLLIVDLNLQQIENICKDVSQGSFSAWISSAAGELVYHPDAWKVGTHLPGEQLTRFRGEQPDSFRTDTPQGEEIVIYETSRVTDWIVGANIPMETIIGNLIRLRNISLGAALLLFMIALSIVGGYSLSITRSLTYLQKLMAKVENGDFNVRITSTRERNDEIGLVFRSFSKMVSELNRLVREVHSSKLKEQELIIKQKESALQSMQAHINPHFLYNSLEIINSHAILENNRSISKMTAALAHIFRYNTGSAGPLVSLEEETAHIRSYLEIQTSRFRNLKVEIDVGEPWLNTVTTVRLTLQPLVENAFIHGYRDKKPAYIGIIGKPRDTYYAVEISDRGLGMSAETAGRLVSLLAGSTGDGPAEPGPDASSPADPREAPPAAAGRASEAAADLPEAAREAASASGGRTADAAAANRPLPDGGASTGRTSAAAPPDGPRLPQKRAAGKEWPDSAETLPDGGGRQGGIGLLNVHQRIRLTFGEEYGVFLLSSAPGEGTCFEIRLPYTK
ncbi:sensor histidine kinase [Paenibacillus sp. UNC499MF]|uniref:cache domain-containing sensor histidine kinase n=1 Tax=Paenibacillus sp. UNC499MF TaxID=1502751 RepID=UPI00089FA349|nr:sensor histidine kinase [Paenibacillus sp. UNC499MF]SEG56468.1 HAMP domain-containing protein [Paenibacillus sp. UNC499MF]